MAAEHSPLSQFEVKPWLPIEIGGVDASFTNASFFMALVVATITLFIVGGMRRAAAVPGRWQSMVEMAYEFVASMLTDMVGKEARKYFPFVFTLFMFILVANLMGMIPGAFTVTSHIIVTFAFAALVFIGVTVIGFINHGLRFLKLFVPSGVPIGLALVLIPIELLSYMVRPVSLSVRLFANMMAGHTMLKVIAGFVVLLGGWGIFPLLGIVALTGLEVLIAVLQAYVFALLTCIYLNDAFHIEH
ncbi:MAG TPA: F0F1 ATP synthase subunit A [Sphingomonadales bacterium]|nr:F0F1 ATP synthase subunit A [Sphingomonadales bacterium]